MHQTLDNATHTLRRWVLRLVRSLLWVGVAALVAIFTVF
jgi:hypothetical protein